MAAGQIPPWIKPADEADYLGRGLQIGASMAAQQAQEEYRNQQLMLEQAQAARQAQQDAIAQQQAQARQALLERQFQIEAKQAAEKSQALLGYQEEMKQPGADPLALLLKYGPAMGQQTTSVAAAERARMAAAAKPQFQEAPSVGHAMFQGKQVPFLWRPGTSHFSWMPSGYADSDSSGALTKADLQELTQLRSDIGRAEAVQNKYLDNPSNPTVESPTDKPATKAMLKAYNDREAALKKMRDREAEILAGSRKGKTASGDQGGSVDEKIARARELRAEHPDWDKATILKQVNTEFSQEFEDAID